MVDVESTWSPRCDELNELWNEIFNHEIDYEILNTSEDTF